MSHDNMFSTLGALLKILSALPPDIRQLAIARIEAAIDEACCDLREGIDGRAGQTRPDVDPSSDPTILTKNQSGRIQDHLQYYLHGW